VIGLLANALAQLKTLQDRLTSGRAAKLDNLDALISSRAAPSDLSNLDAAVSSRATPSDLAHLDAAVSSRASAADYTATRAGYLDKLPTIETAVGSAKTLHHQLFTSSGTWTRPSGVTEVFVEVASGGGAGASCEEDKHMVTCGGGGGIRSGRVVVSGNVTVTVGAGGAGATADSSNTAVTGNPGGESSFGAFSVPAGGPGNIGYFTDADFAKAPDGGVGGPGNTSGSRPGAGDLDINKSVEHARGGGGTAGAVGKWVANATAAHTGNHAAANSAGGGGAIVVEGNGLHSAIGGDGGSGWVNVWWYE